MMVLIRFWRSLTKKDNVKSARYDTRYITFLSTLTQFWDVFSRIQIRIFPDRIRIFGQSGSGLRKESLIQIRKKTLIQNTAATLKKLFKMHILLLSKN